MDKIDNDVRALESDFGNLRRREKKKRYNKNEKGKKGIRKNLIKTKQEKSGFSFLFFATGDVGTSSISL